MLFLDCLVHSFVNKLLITCICLVCYQRGESGHMFRHVQIFGSTTYCSHTARHFEIWSKNYDPGDLGGCAAWTVLHKWLMYSAKMTQPTPISFPNHPQYASLLIQERVQISYNLAHSIKASCFLRKVTYSPHQPL